MAREKISHSFITDRQLCLFIRFHAHSLCFLCRAPSFNVVACSCVVVVDLYCFGSVFWSINCAASGSVFCLINNSADVSHGLSTLGTLILFRSSLRICLKSTSFIAVALHFLSLSLYYLASVLVSCSSPFVTSWFFSHLSPSLPCASPGRFFCIPFYCPLMLNCFAVKELFRLVCYFKCFLLFHWNKFQWLPHFQPKWGSGNQVKCNRIFAVTSVVQISHKTEKN